MKTELLTITRKIEFDAGHRIPDHGSQCRNMHGHRYVLEATVTGEVHQRDGDPENGMVTDFSSLKQLMLESVGNPWDHAFLVYRNDREVLNFLHSLPEHKTVVLDAVPTAENLVRIAAAQLTQALRERYGNAVTLVNLRLYETPNCWADVQPQR
ncbi:MAG: 6-carboxytetrahydropterin synthase [Burkholderiaceae bacterium]|nr:MAG: 6-carboxytetrahydropterin synthase [Burkholderiaceae bacterium]